MQKGMDHGSNIVHSSDLESEKLSIWQVLFEELMPDHLWWYIDPKKEMQGPFEANQLLNWFMKGYLPPTLQVHCCRVQDAHMTSPQLFHFKPIRSFYPQQLQLVLPPHEPQQLAKQQQDSYAGKSDLATRHLDVDVELCEKLFRNQRPTPRSAQKPSWRLTPTAMEEAESAIEWHYVHKEGDINGPIDPESMLLLVHCGDITRNTLVYSCRLGCSPDRLSPGHFTFLRVQLDRLRHDLSLANSRQLGRPAGQHHTAAPARVNRPAGKAFPPPAGRRGTPQPGPTGRQQTDSYNTVGLAGKAGQRVQAGTPNGSHPNTTTTASSSSHPSVSSFSTFVPSTSASPSSQQAWRAKGTVGKAWAHPNAGGASRVAESVSSMALTSEASSCVDWSEFRELLDLAPGGQCND